MKNLAFSILALLPCSAFADSLSFCSAAPATSTSVAGTYGYNTLLSSTSPLVSGACKAPPPPSQCVYGLPSDAPGYVGLCGGWWWVHTGGGNILRGSDIYSYKNIVGNKTNDWPGGPFGTSEFWGVGQSRLNVNQYISIPFTVTSGHTLTFNAAQSYTPSPVSMSISTVQGKFNNGEAGGDVICVKNGARGLPSLVVTSNNFQPSNCTLEVGKSYYFNYIPAYYLNGSWQTRFIGSAQMGITVYQVN